MSVTAACGAGAAAHRPDAAAPGEADAVADALAQAFEGYPWTDWITPPDGRRERLHGLHLLTVSEVGLPYAEVWVVRCPVTPGPGGVVGALVALRPDRPAPREVWAAMAAREEPLFGDRAVALEAAEAATAGLRHEGPSLVVATLGVRPSHRGLGLAGALVARAVAAADALGVPATLETSSPLNVRLYERAGFVVTGQVQVPDGGPRVWAMRRPPRG